MVIGWMVRIEIRGDGNKDSTRGYAVAIRNRDEGIAAAREASGERGARAARCKQFAASIALKTELARLGDVVRGTEGIQS